MENGQVNGRIAMNFAILEAYFLHELKGSFYLS